MRAMLADTQANVDGLKRQVDSLRNTVEENAGRGGRAGGSAVRELEHRVSLLEGRVSAAAAESPASTTAIVETPGDGSAPVASAGTPAAALSMKAEEVLPGGAGADAYRTALDLYRQRQWDKSVVKFREFLQASPKSDFADNAQYWIGECFYNKSDYNRAIIELNEVLLKHPKGDRVPGALLALATAFADSGDKIDARLILQKLVSDHPSTEEAKIGRQKLQALPE